MELKLSAMSANVPGTSTTGSGWLLVGRQDQSLAPGGGESGAASAWATPPKALYGTGSGIRARVAAAALPGPASSISGSTATANKVLAKRPGNGRCRRIAAPFTAPRADVLLAGH